jgi:hypothetical protein
MIVHANAWRGRPAEPDAGIAAALGVSGVVIFTNGVFLSLIGERRC